MQFLRDHAAVINTALLLLIAVFTVPTMLRVGPQLKELTLQIKELRELAGLQGDYQRDLVRYAASVLDRLEALAEQEVVVTTKGPGGKRESLREWIVGARREALALVFVQKSKQGVLRELGQSLALNRTFHLRFPDGREVALVEWLRENHPETAALSP